MVAPNFSIERLEAMHDGWTPSEVRALIDDYRALVHAEPADADAHEHIYSRSARVPGTDSALVEAIRLITGSVPRLAKSERRSEHVTAMVPGYVAEGENVRQALRMLLAMVVRGGSVLPPQPVSE